MMEKYYCADCLEGFETPESVVVQQSTKLHARTNIEVIATHSELKSPCCEAEYEEYQNEEGE